MIEAHQKFHLSLSVLLCSLIAIRSQTHSKSAYLHSNQTMIIMFQVNSLAKTTHRNDTIYSMDACRLTTANEQCVVCIVYSAKIAFKWSWINLNKWCTDYYYNSPSFAVSYHTPFVSYIDKTSTVHHTNMIIVDRWYSSFDVDLSLISLLAEDFFLLLLFFFSCISFAAKFNIDSDGQLFGSLFVRFLWFKIWFVFEFVQPSTMDITWFLLHNEQIQTSIEWKKAINDNLIHQFCSNYAVQWLDFWYLSIVNWYYYFAFAKVHSTDMQLVTEPFEKGMRNTVHEEMHHLISNEPVDGWLLILNLNNVAK